MNRRLILGLVVGSGVCFLLIAAALGMALHYGLFTVAGNLSSGSDSSTSYISSGTQLPVGYVGRLNSGSGAMLEDQLSRLGGGGLPELVLDEGSRAKVITSHRHAAQVEILEGRERGMKPWIRWDCLRRV